MQSNAASKKELELLAKNLADAKKRSDELAALKDKQQKEAESIKVELAATQEKAKAEEQRAAEAKALLLEEKKRADALVASTTKIDERIDTLNRDLKQDLAGVGQELKGVGQELKGVGENIAGVGDKIASVSNEVTSVKQDVSKVGEEVKGVKETVSGVSQEVAGVGSRVETIQQGVSEQAAVQEENFRKLSERQTKTVSEIFSKYEENKVKLTFDYSPRWRTFRQGNRRHFQHGYRHYGRRFVCLLPRSRQGQSLQAGSAAPQVDQSFRDHYQSQAKRADSGQRNRLHG